MVEHSAIGSSFSDFLDELAIREETEAAAQRTVAAWLMGVTTGSNNQWDEGNPLGKDQRGDDRDDEPEHGAADRDGPGHAP